MNTLIESANVKKASIVETNAVAQFVIPFYYSIYQTAVRAVALFWSVFGPAARYDFLNPAYAYAALLKP